tara:strand:+ start:1329 stop:1460 length:132 start_codon:yes stop_codon:yes gene_type:complete
MAYKKTKKMSKGGAAKKMMNGGKLMKKTKKMSKGGKMMMKKMK